MASTSQSPSSLSRGFSVYQPTLGTPLQFFPALGSQELDDMINVFSPGPSSAGEKRAAITFDFFKHVQMTGQTYKFYPVSAPSATASPSTASPSMDSASSSFNVFAPITSSWDWSATSASSISSSSRVSLQRRRESKTRSRPPRHQTTDISHLPGMKILTKDGLDVTDSASRGSKTKEQRDHAHLMRVIKACDNCRRKKIRCDPSHKKRGAAQVAPQSPPKPTKKARTVPSESAPPCHLPVMITNPEIVFPGSSSFDQDLAFSFTGLEDFDPTTLSYDPFDEFVQFPPTDTPDFDSLLDTTDYNSSQSSSSSSSAASPLKSVTPSSQQDSGAPAGAELVNPELQARTPNFPFSEHSGSSSDYTDFNLFSPSSSFSEDERMLPISSSSSSLPNLNEPSLSECPQPSLAAATSGEAIEWSDPGLSIDEVQFHSANYVGGRGRSAVHDSVQLTTRSTLGESGNESYYNLNTTTLSESVGEGVLRCPPGIVVVDGDTSSGGQTLANLPLRSESSAASVSLDVCPSASPGVLVDQAVITGTQSTASAIGSVRTFTEYHAELSIVRRLSGKKALPAELGHQSAPVAAYRTHSDMPTPAAQSHAVDSPESIRSGSHALLSADADAPRQSSTNRPTNLTIDDASSFSQNRTHLIDTGHRTSEATNGLADGTQGVVSSSLEDCNEQRFRLPRSADSTYALASGAPSQGVLAISRRLDIGGDAGPSALCSPTAGTGADLHDGSCDRGTCGTSTPISQAIVAQPLVTSNFAANSPVTSSDTETSLMTSASSNADLASFRTATQLANSFSAMSSLALYVLVATIAAANTSVETRARFANMKQLPPLDKFHRAMSRRSALGLQARLTPVSSMCAA
ncbi:hypothetical protein EsDP_00006629 [Epichloe bromicola]|uniref:Zn(2)-C6 fungal-type domain-containing protein n=1 Tax=Epichloe bromicola TaxID=79588 RepID=A0ABQ0CY67_9HYPO